MGHLISPGCGVGWVAVVWTASAAVHLPLSLACRLEFTSRALDLPLPLPHLTSDLQGLFFFKPSTNPRLATCERVKIYTEQIYGHQAVKLHLWAVGSYHASLPGANELQGKEMEGRAGKEVGIPKDAV